MNSIVRLVTGESQLSANRQGKGPNEEGWAARPSPFLVIFKTTLGI
jgi:hypothetical protein